MGNNSSVKRSILTKLVGYRESIVLIMCTKNELNLPTFTEIWFRTDKRKVAVKLPILKQGQ